MTKRPYEEVAAEVNQITDACGEPIDEKIKSLVIGLMIWGVRTTSSCEGHEDNERFPFPWVDVDKRDVVILVELVQRQNRPVLLDGTVNKNQWAVMPFLIEAVRLVPLNQSRPLADMEADANEFGQFLRDLPDDWRNKYDF